MPQPFDVLQPGATAQHVVGQVQHVIGLVVGQVHPQQRQVLVDLLGQAQPGHQPVHRGDPPETGGIHVAADLVPDRARGQHRDQLWAPVPGQGVPGGDPAPPSGRVPAALILRYLLHHKGLLSWAALASQTQAE
jgi:hypothetical protein